jgi:transcriptional regulator with XRE-family HTH domain
MPSTLAQLIRERRQDLGLTQEELAERLGPTVRQTEISRLESGRIALPRRLRMEQLARALQLPLGTLLLGSGWAGAEGLDSESPSAGDDPFNATGQLQESVDELAALNTGLQDTVDKLQLANERLRGRGADKGNDLHIAEDLVAQLRAVLNALHDPVVVVSRTGFVVTENSAYAAFAAQYTDAPPMRDANGVLLADGDLPLERAARGERFRLEAEIENSEGRRLTYEVTGEPASTLHGGLLGVVSFHRTGERSPA